MLPDLVEAAERSGHHSAAHRLTGQLAALAEASPVPRTLGFLARARALTAREADAEPHYQAAIDHHIQTRGPAHRARSHLVYGEWLRRTRRPRDAREQLRTAYRLFAEMGAQGFAARARLELSAAGKTVGPAAADVDHGLTRRKPGWPAWPRRAPPMRRSPPSSTSAPAPWTTTSGRCSGSWA